MKQRIVELAFLVAVLVAGYLLRVTDLELYRMSPDEGNYLFSAGVAQIEQNPEFGPGLAADIEWLLPRYYPHSYLHQLAIRWTWRFGANAVTSVRLDSALLGILSSLVIFLFAKRILAGRPWAAVVAAGIVALQCLHVWYSRTGWGATGCTTFIAVYLALGYELVRCERRLIRDLGLGLLMGIASVLAFGWHEMVVVHVGGMGLFILLHHVWGGPGFQGSGFLALPKTLRTSGKAWAALVSALPMVGLFIGLLGSRFAKRHWLDFDDPTGPTLLEILKGLFAREELQFQFAWPVLLLAAFGFLRLRKTDRLAARYLITALLSSSLIFLLFFKDAYLVRIYLPTALILAVLAGNGFGELIRFVDDRWRGLAGASAALLLLGWFGLISATTIHSWVDGEELFFEPRFHHLDGYEFVDSRDVHESTFSILRARLEPGEVVGVEQVRKKGHPIAGEFSVLFRLRDARIPAAPFAFDRPVYKWPRFLMGVKVGMNSRGRSTQSGGRYREIGADRFGRIALYELDLKR